MASFDSHNLIQIGLKLNPTIPEQFDQYDDEEVRRVERARRRLEYETKLREDLEARFGDICYLVKNKDHEAAKESNQERKIEHML